MRGPGYPAGVPTPFVAHVHPYPTRFHGAIYSRPVFGMPQIQTPASVFIPGRDIDMRPDRPYVGNAFSGLGEVQYNVGEGIFRPGGYGGGVFDGNLAGAPSLGTRSRGKNTLGAGLDLDATRKADAVNFPYGTFSDKTLELQTNLNKLLVKNKLCPITADGKLGPATCGASANKAVMADPEFLTLQPFTPLSCEGKSMAAPKSSAGGCGSGSPTVFAPTTANISTSPIMSSSTKKMIGFAAGALGAVGLVYYMKKKRR